MPRIEILSPHGMCAGVTAAIAKAMKLRDAYFLHAIVHNEIVLEELKARGCRFVDRLEDVPQGATVVFSAHGVSPSVREEAAKRKLTVVDTTCRFVARLHETARKFAKEGKPVVIIGDRGHAETDGIAGEVEARAGTVIVGRNMEEIGPLAGLADIGVIAQTTMNSDEVARIVKELRKRGGSVAMAEVCTATKNRQDAVRDFCAKDGNRALIVLGSATSANVRRLVEVAEAAGVRAHLVGTLEELRSIRDEISSCEILGVTSGASTPDIFFRQAIDTISHDL